MREDSPKDYYVGETAAEIDRLRRQIEALGEKPKPVNTSRPAAEYAKSLQAQLDKLQEDEG